MATIVVVGSGAAGLTVALEASARHEVVLLSKDVLGESNSLYAQGGIAAATSADDSVDSHLADTLAAGAGAADPAVARILCAEGPESIRELIRLGLEFDRDDDELARGREGAHSVARVLHAGGDATGRAVVATLRAAVRAARVEVREHAFVCEILVRDGAVRGVSVLQHGVLSEIAADAVVIATGGAGQLYAHTTNPAGATGDGIAAAARAGARLADLEFYQFHPTALAMPGTPLVSEAVRGEGAVLLDAAGRRFMPAVHPAAELAPRDVVARAIAGCMAGQEGAPVFLDATGLGARVAERFPSFARLCAQHGLDPAREPVPVTPAAHYWMGGIAVDPAGRSTVPGLYAVGEAARTGAHGANRLASNSLLEALVFARRTAAALGEAWQGAPVPFVSAPGTATGAVPGAVPVDRAALQHLMWRHVGLSRDARGLAQAARTLDGCRGETGGAEARETANLLQLARAVVAAARARTTSLGAHYRNDSAEAGHGIHSCDHNQEALAS